MPFNTLCLTCLKSGTSFGESGGQISVKPTSGETILFFSIDDQSNPKSTFRNDLEICGSLCDLIIFYYEKNEEKKVLCLVELKGSDIDYAKEQITNTLKALKSKFRRIHSQQITWKAYVHMSGSSPKNSKKVIEKELESIFEKGNCKISRDKDIGNFIRS